MEKKIIGIGCLSLLLIIMGPSCERDSNPNSNGILGEWEWLYSTGGLAGDSIYPKEGQTVTLELTEDSLLIERENGNTTLESEFTILGDTLKYYASNAEILSKIKISKDRLYLRYLKIYDGYDPVYKRLDLRHE